MNRETHHMLTRLENLGITPDDALALRRIAMTLHRWHELECGVGDTATYLIERDEQERPHMMRSDSMGVHDLGRIPDREAGALRRLIKIMASYPMLAAYVQGDPRGAALYIYHKDSPALVASKHGIESCYSSIGVAVFK